MKKVLVFGALNIDYVYSMDHFVEAGETISSNNLKVFCGGKGLNQSIALKRSGVDVWHAGAVGANDSGMLYDSLEKCGIHTDFVMSKNCPSGHAIIQNIPDGENCIILYGGANQEITVEDVDKVMEHFGEGDFIVLQNEINQMPYIMERAYQRKMKIVLNPSPMNEKIFRMPLQYVDYLILNKVEATELCKRKRESVETEHILEALMEEMPEVRIVLTLGVEGSMYGYRDEKYFQPSIKVKAIDTTAAGDTYTGFFLGSLIQGKSVPESLEIASKAAAIAVSRSGASSSIPDLEEVR